MQQTCFVFQLRPQLNIIIILVAGTRILSRLIDTTILTTTASLGRDPFSSSSSGDQRFKRFIAPPPTHLLHLRSSSGLCILASQFTHLCKDFSMFFLSFTKNLLYNPWLSLTATAAVVLIHWLSVHLQIILSSLSQSSV